MKDRGVFEVPPKGYKGSRKGTSWDTDDMNDAFFQSATTVSTGAVS